jgi:2-phospho-L-lactate/phosphoenolpyruvate guanylyltransferase
MILVPVKDLKNAKQRLAAILDQAARTQLAQAMLEDVLEALASWSARPGVALVTRDPFGLQLASRFDFEVIMDHANTSETDAIAMATHICETRHVESTLVIPADIPFIAQEELAQIYASAPAQGSVLVPASDGRGTNAAFRRPAGLFPLRFGNDSFQPHLAAAEATGMPCVVLKLAGIGIDVDNPADLKQLIDAPGQRKSQVLARQWKLKDFPVNAGE